MGLLMKRPAVKAPKTTSIFNTNIIETNINNNEIENDLVDSWRVLYYFSIGDFVLTFTIEEYDFVYQTLKSFVRNNRINKVLE
jgi:hypothetical protein